MKTKEAIIDDIMTHIEMSEQSHQSGSRIHRVPLSYFKEAEPVGLGEEGTFHEDGAFWYRDVSPKEIDLPFDVSMVGPGVDCGQALTLIRARSLSPKQVRGKVRELFPIMADITAACPMFNGTYESTKLIVGYLGDYKWKVIGNQNPHRMADHDDNVRISIAMGTHFHRRYQWRAVVGYGHSGSVSFVVDPMAAKSIFRLRDVPDGKQRKSAIRNWICEHWRKKPSNEAEETNVRRHLRGATEFKWNGFFVKIIPSPFDVEQNERLALGVAS